MTPNHKGQTALEYLLIVVVAIIVVVSVMVFMQGLTGDIKESANKSVEDIIGRGFEPGAAPTQSGTVSDAVDIGERGVIYTGDDVSGVNSGSWLLLDDECYAVIDTGQQCDGTNNCINVNGSVAGTNDSTYDVYDTKRDCLDTGVRVAGDVIEPTCESEEDCDAGQACVGQECKSCGSSTNLDFCTNCYQNGGTVKDGEAGCWCESKGYYVNAWFGDCPECVDDDDCTGGTCVNGGCVKDRGAEPVCDETVSCGDTWDDNNTIKYCRDLIDGQGYRWVDPNLLICDSSNFGAVADCQGYETICTDNSVWATCDPSVDCATNFDVNGEAHYCRGDGTGVYLWITEDEALSACSTAGHKGRVAYCSTNGVIHEVICTDDLTWATCTQNVACGDSVNVLNVPVFCRNLDDLGWAWTACLNCGDSTICTGDFYGQMPIGTTATCANTDYVCNDNDTWATCDASSIGETTIVNGVTYLCEAGGWVGESPSLPRECLSNADCPQGQLCLEGICVGTDTVCHPFQSIDVDLASVTMPIPIQVYDPAIDDERSISRMMSALVTVSNKPMISGVRLDEGPFTEGDKFILADLLVRVDSIESSIGEDEAIIEYSILGNEGWLQFQKDSDARAGDACNLSIPENRDFLVEGDAPLSLSMSGRGLKGICLENNWIIDNVGSDNENDWQLWVDKGIDQVFSVFHDCSNLGTYGCGIATEFHTMSEWEEVNYAEITSQYDCDDQNTELIVDDDAIKYYAFVDDLPLDGSYTGEIQFAGRTCDVVSLSLNGRLSIDCGGVTYNFDDDERYTEEGVMDDNGIWELDFNGGATILASDLVRLEGSGLLTDEIPMPQGLSETPHMNCYASNTEMLRFLEFSLQRESNTELPTFGQINLPFNDGAGFQNIKQMYYRGFIPSDLGYPNWTTVELNLDPIKIEGVTDNQYRMVTVDYVDEWGSQITDARLDEGPFQEGDLVLGDNLVRINSIEFNDAGTEVILEFSVKQGASWTSFDKLNDNDPGPALLFDTTTPSFSRNVITALDDVSIQMNPGFVNVNPLNMGDVWYIRTLGSDNENDWELWVDKDGDDSLDLVETSNVFTACPCSQASSVMTEFDNQVWFCANDDILTVYGAFNSGAEEQIELHLKAVNDVSEVQVGAQIEDRACLDCTFADMDCREVSRGPTDGRLESLSGAIIVVDWTTLPSGVDVITNVVMTIPEDELAPTIVMGGDVTRKELTCQIYDYFDGMPMN